MTKKYLENLPVLPETDLRTWDVFKGKPRVRGGLRPRTDVRCPCGSVYTRGSTDYLSCDSCHRVWELSGVDLGDVVGETGDGGMDFKRFEGLVIDWASTRGILGLSDPVTQCMKTQEELNELKQALLDNDRGEIIDALGDIVVTLIIQARLNGLDLMGCCEVAWGQIKDRKGTMVDGFFVKEPEPFEPDDF